MNKYYYILILLSFHLTVFSQNDSIKLESAFWLNENFIVFSFGDNESKNTYIRNHFRKESEELEYEIRNDSLILKPKLDIIYNNKNEIPEFIFSILKHNKSELSLIPISVHSKDYFEDIDTINLRPEIEKQENTNFKLQEIKLVRSGYKLHINNSREIFLNLSSPTALPLNVINRMDKSTFGKYIGKLSKREFKEIEKLLLKVGVNKNEDFTLFRNCSICLNNQLTIKYNNKEINNNYDWVSITLKPLINLLNKHTDLSRLKKE